VGHIFKLNFISKTAQCNLFGQLFIIIFELRMKTLWRPIWNKVKRKRGC